VHTRFKGLYKFVPQLTDRPFSAIANLAADRAEFYGMGPLARTVGASRAETITPARIAQIHLAHRTLRSGGTVGAFIDLYQGAGGIEVPLLGRKRPIKPGIAELALDTGAVIIPVEQWLHEGGHITIAFKPPFVPEGSTRDQQVLSLMIQQAAALETMWRENPAQMDTEALRYQLDLDQL